MSRPGCDLQGILGHRTRPDGARQWVYKGFALYTYAGDKPGDINGNEIYDLAQVRDTARPAAASAAAAMWARPPCGPRRGETRARHSAEDRHRGRCFVLARSHPVTRARRFSHPAAGLDAALLIASLVIASLVNAANAAYAAIADGAPARIPDAPLVERGPLPRRGRGLRLLSYAAERRALLGRPGAQHAFWRGLLGKHHDGPHGTGIGAWSKTQFERALREGIGADGKNLYPAFPVHCPTPS